MVEIKIPNDPALLLAVAAYFTRLAGGNVRQVHDENIVAGPLTTQPGDSVTPAEAFATSPVITGGTVNIGAPSPGPTTYTPPPGAAVGVVTETPEPEPQATYNVHPEVDGRGYQWDARIHSSSKAILAKAPHGWKLIRGVDAALVEQVEAEQRARGYGVPRATAKPPAASPVTPPPPNLAATFPPSDSFDTPAPAAPPLTFAQVMARIGAANKLTEAQGALAQFGLPSFPVLGAKPELWEPFLASVGA